jgi:hypothetical protein
MNVLNLTDLVKSFVFFFVVFTVVYYIFNAFARGRFLRDIVNPNQGVFLFVAGMLVIPCFYLLRAEAGTNSPADWVRLFSSLVTEEKSGWRVTVAFSCLLFAGVFVLLVIWCRMRLPKPAVAFRKPLHRQAAIDYFTHMRGGIDYAIMIWCHAGPTGQLEMETVAESDCTKQIMNRIDELRPRRTLAEQIEAWRQLARSLHEFIGLLNDLVEIGMQGRHRRIVFDVEVGAFSFRFLRPPDEKGNCKYLFAATYHQDEVNSRRFEEHFDLLYAALMNIERQVIRGSA